MKISTIPQERPIILSLEQVSHKAKERLLQTGFHPPTIIAEGTNGTFEIEFDEWAEPDWFDEALSEGTELAQPHLLGTLRQCFLCELYWSPLALQPHLRGKEGGIDVLSTTHHIITTNTNIVAYRQWSVRMDKSINWYTLNLLEPAHRILPRSRVLLETFLDGVMMNAESASKIL
jgi:hypothetical protein